MSVLDALQNIGEKAARQLMVGAFVGEVFDKIGSDAVRSRIDAILAERFGWVIE